MFCLENNHVYTVRLTWILTQQLRIILLNFHIQPMLHVSPRAPHTTETPCNITKDPSTEESEGYTQLLQTYEVELNNIMNPNNGNSGKSIGQAEEVDKNLIQENASLHIRMNENEACLQHLWIMDTIIMNWWNQYF